ncbi:hypothetical protein HKD37_14G040046 [Glycine soja]
MPILQYYLITGTTQINGILMGSTITYQFVSAFHNGRNIIEIPSFYHIQWAPNDPSYVRFVRKYHHRYFFADGLKYFRKDLNIHESVTITFIAYKENSIFHVHFMPPLDKQTCGRPLRIKRTYVWTVQVNETMISTPEPLVLPPTVIPYVDTLSQHMTLLTKNHDCL